MRSTYRLQRLVLAVLCACVSISGFAQSSPYKPGSPVLMWKVSSKTNSAYILGSVHLGDKSMYPLPAVVENAFNAASVLIVEVGSKDADQMQSQLQQLVAVKGIYPPGDDLFHHITPETRAKLETFLARYGYPAVLIARFRPWMAALTVSMLPLIKDGLNPNQGIDLYFINKANGKRIEQLEDPAWQINLLADMPEKDSDRFISRAITQAENSKDHWTKLTLFWSEGAGDKIDDLMAGLSVGENAEEKAFSRRLREDRNPHMTARLEKCLESSESCFMVVGAAHVVGREGIVKQLQSRGYRVEQAIVEKTPAAAR